jgi:ABC-type multidrug transport system fused ATPase/permease subunit
MVIGGIGIGFFTSGVFAVATWIYIPFFLLYAKKMGGKVKGATIKKMGQVGKLGGLTSETLSAIKLVFSFA